MNISQTSLLSSFTGRPQAARKVAKAANKAIKTHFSPAKLTAGERIAFSPCEFPIDAKFIKTKFSPCEFPLDMKISESVKQLMKSQPGGIVTNPENIKGKNFRIG